MVCTRFIILAGMLLPAFFSLAPAHVSTKQVYKALTKWGRFDTRRLLHLVPAVTRDEFIEICSGVTQLLIALYQDVPPTVRHHEYFMIACKQLHTLFSSLFVDSHSDTLVYCTDQALLDQQHNLVPFLTFCKTHNHTFFVPLYAFYFEQIAFLFINSCHEAFEDKDDSKLFVRYLSRAERYYAQLHTTFRYLACSEYEVRYAQQLVRYHELLALVRKEHKAQGVLE